MKHTFSSRALAGTWLAFSSLWGAFVALGIGSGGSRLLALPAPGSQPFPTKVEPPPPVAEALEAAKLLHLSPEKDPALVDTQVVLWEGLAAAYRGEDDVKEQLALTYMVKLEQTHDPRWAARALSLWEELLASRSREGKRLPTDHLRRVLVFLKDAGRLEATLKPLVTGSDLSPRDRYLATVDLAQGLVELGQQEEAFALFERAIRERPEACEEAVIRYAKALLAAGRPQRALELAEWYAPEDRLALPPLAFVRLEALKALGLPTQEAEAEVARLKALWEALPVGGHFRSGRQAQAFGGPPWAHNLPDDDCRLKDYTWLWCDQWSACFPAFTVNFAEVLYNEARGENWASITATAWVVRNRALGRLSGVWTASGQWAGSSCDSYPGGWYSHSTCAGLPCGDDHPQFCDLSRWYCCAIHGGTVSVGSDQWQFNDTHVPWSDLQNTGIHYAAFYVMNGLAPDMSQPGSGHAGWVPPGVSGCSVGCPVAPEGSPQRRLPWCLYGSNVFDANPNGAMEFRDHEYQPPIWADCKQPKGTVCGGRNFFWNRLNHQPVGRNDPFWDFSKVTGCAADPDTPWEVVDVDIWVEDPPNSGSWRSLGRVSAGGDYGGPCQINGKNYGRWRKFSLPLPTKYRTGSWRFRFRVWDTWPSKGSPEGFFEWVALR